MKMGQSLERVVDVITEILAFFTVLFILFVYLNRAFDFVTSEKALGIIESVREISVLLIVGLAGLQFALKRGFIIFIVYAAVVAFAIILMFFPNVLPFNAGEFVQPVLSLAI